MIKGISENRIFIGLALKHLRKIHGMTQDDLSEKSLITVQSISTLETGTGNPVLSNLEKLAKVLQTTAPDLINLGKELHLSVQPRLKDAFAAKVRSRRQELKMTQLKLAMLSGVSLGYVNSIESAKNSATLDVLERVAVALDVDPEDLIKK